MRKLCIIVTGLFCTLLFTTCKQYSADIENDLSYWSSVVTAGAVTCDKPSQINTSGAMCIPSVTDVAFALKVRNPKHFTLVTPTSSADAGRVIRFPHLPSQPVYGTDYTLRQTSSDTLTLVYKSAFLKKHEWNTGNIGPEITFISTDGRVFSERFNTNIEVNTPPKLSYATIGKTANPIGGKHYYVIILKADEMGQTAGTATPAEKLHKDIKTLSVTGRESGNVAFTSGDTAFFVDTSIPLANRRLLADTEVAQLGSGEGQPQPPYAWASSLNSDPWSLRYRTDTEVGTAATVYTFRLADEKGLISDEVSVPTSQTQAQDVQLFDGANEIPAEAALPPPASPPPSSMHTIDAESSAANVTVKAKTATVGAIITGRVEKYNGSTWEQVGALLNSGSHNEVNIDLPAPTPNAELAYKITLTAGGIGFSPGNEKVFYVKVKSTVTINGSEGGAWKKLKAAVAAAQDGDIIKISGTITATPGSSGENRGKIDINRNITIERAAGAPIAVLNANKGALGSNAHPIFRVSNGKTLKLKNLTLKGGQNSGTFGGAINVTGGSSKAELTDCTIEDCQAGQGGAIGCGKGTAVTLTNTTIQNCKAHTLVNNGTGGAIYAQGATVNITGCTLTGNTAELKGGAICAVKADSTNSTVTIEGGIIGGAGSGEANKATGSSGEGGGIYAGENCTVTLQNNARVIGNKAGTDGRGGGIYAEKATVNMTNCTFESNTATKSGGGVYASSATVTMTNCTLSGNKADNDTDDGTSGGIYTYQGNLTMAGCTLTGNTARLDGGGVRAEKTPVTMTNCTFTGNKARCGGAICASKGGADVTIEGGTIGGTGVNDANKVTASPQSSGGGIHIEGGATVTLKGSVKVIGNKAPGSAEGAGVYVNCYSTLQMQESAQVHTNNDVFLQEYSSNAAKIIVAGALTPQGGIAARITVADNRYNMSTQVLDGSAVGSEHGKFTVTPKSGEYWIVKSNGYLTNTTTDIFANISKNQIKAAESSMIYTNNTTDTNNIKITDRQTKLLNKLILYKTNIGNYGIMHVTEVHNTNPSGFGHIKFNYKTFNDNGTVKNAHDNREVNGTFFFDLDEESTSETDRDFWLENTGTASSTRHFTPKNGAKFYVLP